MYHFINREKATVPRRTTKDGCVLNKAKTFNKLITEKHSIHHEIGRQATSS